MKNSAAWTVLLVFVFADLDDAGSFGNMDIAVAARPVSANTAEGILATALAAIENRVLGHRLSINLPSPTVMILIRNLDFQQLENSRGVFHAFKVAIKQAVASQAGNGIEPQDITLVLSTAAVSVVVQVTIANLSASAVKSLRSILEDSSSLVEALASGITAIDGIAAVSRGTIDVKTATIPAILVAGGGDPEDGDHEPNVVAVKKQKGKVQPDSQMAELPEDSTWTLSAWPQLLLLLCVLVCAASICRVQADRFKTGATSPYPKPELSSQFFGWKRNSPWYRPVASEPPAELDFKQFEYLQPSFRHEFPDAWQYASIIEPSHHLSMAHVESDHYRNASLAASRESTEPVAIAESFHYKRASFDAIKPTQSAMLGGAGMLLSPSPASTSSSIPSRPTHHGYDWAACGNAHVLRMAASAASSSPARVPSPARAASPQQVSRTNGAFRWPRHASELQGHSSVGLKAYHSSAETTPQSRSYARSMQAATVKSRPRLGHGAEGRATAMR